MPQYLDRMTPREVESVVTALEATVREMQRRPNFERANYIVFAPKQVLKALRTKAGDRGSMKEKVEILGIDFMARAGVMPNILPRRGYLGRSR